MKIQTSKLQQLLAKANKGAGNNKLFIITQYITIKCKDNNITLLSTDGNNYLYVSEDVSCEDFTVTVKADTFCSLVNKMTCDEIELTIANNVLNVKGNGDYQIGTLDEAGITEITNPFKDIDFSDTIEVNTKELNNYLAIAKPSLALSLEQPYYTGYYIGKKLIATDVFQITAIDKNLFDKDVLLLPTTANLLNLMTDDTIKVGIADNGLKFTTDNITIYTKELGGKEEYQIDSINSLLDMGFENNCVINRQNFIEALNRLELFVDFFDKQAINMKFTKDKVILTTRNGNGYEAIDYVSSNIQTDDYDCIIDIKLLQAQLNVISKDMINLYFKDEKDASIKLQNDDITQIIVLMTE